MLGMTFEPVPFEFYGISFHSVRRYLGCKAMKEVPDYGFTLEADLVLLSIGASHERVAPVAVSCRAISVNFDGTGEPLPADKDIAKGCYKLAVAIADR